MRTLVAVSLGLALTFAPAACGKKKSPSEQEGTGIWPGSTDEPVASDEAESAADKRKAAAERAKEASEAAQESDKLLGYARAPLTAKDVTETIAFGKAWRANEANQRARAGFKAVEDIDHKDESTAAEMKKTRTITSAVGAIDAVEDAFAALVQSTGGPERHWARSTRVSALVAAAETIAKTEKVEDPALDRVADAMLAQRAEIAKEFRASIDELLAANKRGDRDSPIVSAFIEGPGAIALALMPEASFQAWRQLTEAQRREARDLVKDTIPITYLIEYPAGATLYAAALELAKDKPEAVLPQ
jgi:hypothetical protein